MHQLHLEEQEIVRVIEAEFETERTKRRDAFEAKLQEEYQEIKANSEIEKYYAVLEDLEHQIRQNHKIVQIQQEQMRNQVEEQSFKEAHSIHLIPQDIEDIKFIRDCSSHLKRHDGFDKLIWTEYIQKPIQQLCKTVGAEKKTGIYKITNMNNQMSYIGQSVDIAARWKEHCKLGLGIGSTSYLTNKFYKALHNEGIENFTFEILEECPRIELNDKERYWIEYFNTVQYGYNSKIGG